MHQTTMEYQIIKYLLIWYIYIYLSLRYFDIANINVVSCYERGTLFGAGIGIFMGEYCGGK